MQFHIDLRPGAEWLLIASSHDYDAVGDKWLSPCHTTGTTPGVVSSLGSVATFPIGPGSVAGHGPAPHSPVRTDTSLGRLV